MRLFFRIVSSFLLASVISGALSSCSLLSKLGRKKKKAPVAQETITIGVIEMVNPEQRYILIRSEGMLALPAGTELVSTDATGAESKLLVTPERKGIFMTADVKSGSPHVSNIVVYRRAKPVAPAASASPETQGTSTPTEPGLSSPPATATAPETTGTPSTSLPQSQFKENNLPPSPPPAEAAPTAMPTLEPVVR